MIIYITTNASNIDWGAVCGADKACGAWTFLEQHLHINRLELLAVLFDVKALVRSKRNLFIKVSIDNTTAVVYINNMGGMRQALDCISSQIGSGVSRKIALLRPVMCQAFKIIVLISSLVNIV